MASTNQQIIGTTRIEVGGSPGKTLFHCQDKYLDFFSNIPEYKANFKNMKNFKHDKH